MDSFSVKSAAPGVLDADSLGRLTALQMEGQALLDEYGKFEAQAKEQTGEEQKPYVELVRAQFEADFLRLMQLVGQAFALDLDGAHPAYELHIKVPWTLKEYGLIDPQQYDMRGLRRSRSGNRPSWISSTRTSTGTSGCGKRRSASCTTRSVRRWALCRSTTSRKGVLDTNGHEPAAAAGELPWANWKTWAWSMRSSARGSSLRKSRGVLPSTARST